MPSKPEREYRQPALKEMELKDHMPEMELKDHMPETICYCGWCVNSVTPQQWP